LRAAVDLLLPPTTHSGAPAGSGGLDADAFARITFLEAPVCDGCGAGLPFDPGPLGEPRCAACLARPFRFARARAACVYDEASRDAILRLKHADQQSHAPLFARWIARAAADLLAEADAIAPVPLHPWRLLSRRANQAAEIARPLARLAEREYLADALVRVRSTDSQGGKSARGRRINVRKAFRVTPAGAQRVRGRRILLVDDVLTTGATAEACAGALLDAGARAVDLAVVARVRTARTLPM
jgi:ComF family protein